MEGDVVLAHELVELDVLRVLPPLVPLLLRVVGRDRQVADGRVEPHVEHLVLVLLDGNGRAPLEVAGDAPALEALLEQRARELYRVGGPLALLGSALEPLLVDRLNLGQVDEDVLRLADLGRRARDLRLRVDQLRRVKQLPALVALVASRVVVTAQRACAAYESVSEEQALFHIIKLLDCFLVCKLVSLEFVEYILSDARLPLSGRAAEVVEITVEPVVDLLVYSVVMVTDLLRGLALFDGFDLSCCAILVSTTHVERVVAHQAAVASEHISAQDAPNNVSQVRHVVHVWQSRCDEDVALALFWQKETLPRDAAKFRV